MNTLNHSDIVDRWPSPAALAEDLGVKERTARQWKHRNSIPAWYWAKLLDKARERRIYVTHDDLTRGAARRIAA